MAFAHVQGTSVLGDTAAATIAVTLTGIGAGNALIAWAKWEDSQGGTSSCSDGTSSFVVGTRTDHANGFVSAQFFWLLVANGGTQTITVTLPSAAADFRRLIVAEFSYTGLASLDAQNVGQGTGTAIASGAITTVGSDGLAVGSFGEFTGTTTSSELVNGIAATEPAESPAGGTGFSSLWYQILSASFSNGTASATIGVSSAWICHILALQATPFPAAAGLSSSIAGTPSVVVSW